MFKECEGTLTFTTKKSINKTVVHKRFTIMICNYIGIIIKCIYNLTVYNPSFIYCDSSGHIAEHGYLQLPILYRDFEEKVNLTVGL